VTAHLRSDLAEATSRLAAAGVASPRNDAELLAAHVLGLPRGRLLLVDAFTPDEAAAFAALLDRRVLREPLQHLLGTVAFGAIELAVGPGGFVPRPETELLVAWALALDGPPSLVLDLCSGTGAIALAVAHAWPAAHVVAVERDAAALGWLRRNASARVDAGDRPVEVVAGDVTVASVTAAWHGRVDLVLCNPPYVPAGCDVPTEVAVHDPAVAVFGGPSGLDVIIPVVGRAAALLRPGGRVGIEHDDSHGRAVVDLFDADGAFTAATLHHDLAGRPRFSTAARR
jgi:release factor glutamine methyltransferase